MYADTQYSLRESKSYTTGFLFYEFIRRARAKVVFDFDWFEFVYSHHLSLFERFIKEVCPLAEFA